MPISTRLLTQADAAMLEAFIMPHTAEAYYIRSNALAGGLDYAGKFLQAEYFGAFEGEKLVGVIAYSWINTVLIFAQTPAARGALAKAVRPSILKRGGVIEAFLGPARQVEGLIEALLIPPNALKKSSTDADNLYALDIANMRLPPMPEGCRVRLAEGKDKEQLILWRVAFNIESLHATPGRALEEKVRSEITNKLHEKEIFILEKDKAPIAFCGLTGSVPDTLIVGSVFTPPALRRRGYARVVTAQGIALRAAQNPELRRAVLFASRVDAVRAYEAIGFIRIAPWGFVLLKDDFRLKPQGKA